MTEPNARGYWRQNEIHALRESLASFAYYDRAQGDPDTWRQHEADRRRLAELEQTQQRVMQRLARIKAQP